MSYSIQIDTPLNLQFEPFWFNSEEYSSKHPTTQTKYIAFENESSQIFIRFWLNEEERIWLSPYRAPFGGIEFSSETNRQTLYEFIKEVISLAKKENIKKIRIVSSPECYDMEKSDKMDEVFLHAGFSVSITELNYHLDTKEGDFENNIHDSEKRRLKKCIKAGFTCSVETNPDYDSIHTLISDCRKRKGHPLSMNKMDFKEMFQNFPENYILFVVKDKDKMIAVSIGVKVSSKILYSFLPADHPDYLSYSPMVMLNKGMYDYCAEFGFDILDLGISTAVGIRNEGLIKFKEHLGAKLSHKYSYEINL